MEKAARDTTFSFDAGALTPDEVARRTADMWADLPWDRESLSRLKRDGLVLEGLNLGGACPYRFTLDDAGQIVVSAPVAEHAETLIDLWRLHFLRGFRARPLAA
ncbi:hypothetical protein [Sphingomonas oryzagri]